jgi:hypothetical protein
VIAHVVLFKTRADLADADREAFVASFLTALAAIPVIRSARVGRRVRLGRYYDDHNAIDFSFIAVLEFEDEEGLRAYLDHPAHEDLGTRFYMTSEAALAFDFEMLPGADIRNALATRRSPGEGG